MDAEATADAHMAAGLGGTVKEVSLAHLEVLRRMIRSSRDGCDVFERFPNPDPDLRAKVENSVTELRADLGVLEELSDILFLQLLRGGRFDLSGCEWDQWCEVGRRSARSGRRKGGSAP